MLLTAWRFRQCCAALLGLAALWIGSAGSFAQGPPPALVRVGEVLEEQLQQRVTVIGRLRETNRSLVAAEQAGKLLEVPVDNGSIVGPDTMLARVEPVWAEIDVAEARAKLAEARAQVEQLQAEVDQARLEANRLQELLNDKAARPREVEVANADLAAKRGQLDAMKARVIAREVEVNRAQQQLERLTVRAPFDGVVVAKLVEVGQWVDSGTPVAEVVSRGQIDVMLDVPERIVNDVRPGDMIDFKVDALDKEFEARTDAVIPVANNAARTFPVRLRTSDENGMLKAGMSVTAWLPTGRTAARLTVPRDAIVRQPTGNVVWANIDGKGMPVSVRVLFGQGDRYAIEPLDPAGLPLRPGTQVVIEGAERLFPTRPLKIADQPGPQAAAD